MNHPQMFISIGNTGAFFTLRETYVHINARGDQEVRSHHVCNLSQDVAIALAKAAEAAEAAGVELVASEKTLQAEMREIQRATSDERYQRAREQQARENRREQELAQHEQHQREQIEAGIYHRGPYAGQAFRDAPRSYITWLVRNVEAYEPGSVMRLLCERVAACCADMLLPEPTPGVYAGQPGKRDVFRVTVIRCASYARECFRTGRMELVYIVAMVDRDTGACLVSKSAAFRTDAGQELTIKATVKEHTTYRDAAQTVVQRVAVL